VHSLVVAGADLIDGSGAARRRVDIGIADGLIAEIAGPGTLRGQRNLDATGLVVAPGFIDAHVHLDATLLSEPAYEAGIRQGVTTVVLGQDGLGYAPASTATLEYMRVYCAGINGSGDGSWDWRSTGEYLARLDKRTAVNVAYLVPHGCLRMEAMGLAPRAATDGEIVAMQQLAAQAMQEGAVGFSTGLSYVPASYAETRELLAIGQAVAPYDGVFATHMRDYVHEIDASIDESLAVGRASGIRVHLSHLNMHASQGLPAIDAARAQGIQTTFDTYPYLAGLTLLTRYFPDWALEGGPEATLAKLAAPELRAKLREHIAGPSNIWKDRRLMSIGARDYSKYEGVAPLAAAAMEGRDLTDFLCDVMVASNLDVSILGFRHDRQNEDDMRVLMAHPAHVFGSDGIYRGANPHPRGYGTFARALGVYVRDSGTLRLEQAIQHMSSSTAAIFGLHDRGIVKSGMSADLVVFDPDTIADRSTYEDGDRLAVGVRDVIVNGMMVLDNGLMTGALSGRALRRRSAPARGTISLH
jgi:N-acyl-D-amino-acid deacylase